jgi:hypothetical protein
VEEVEFSKWPPPWKIILAQMTWSDVISEVDAVMYVVLSKAEKYVPYRELVGTSEFITLYPR